MEFIEKKDVIDIFHAISDKIHLNKDMLISLDAQLGDGDLGLTMDEGFSRIADSLNTSLDIADIGKLIKKCGLVMSDAAPSTMGTLLAIGMIRAGDSAIGKEKLMLPDICTMLKNAIDAIIQRGRVKGQGGKTILDALIPAYDALTEADKRHKSVKAALTDAYEAAKDGSESTKNMKSTVGKAAVYGEKSIGLIDPGSVVITLIFECIADFVNKKDHI